MSLNIDIKKELLILLGGPFFQILAYFILKQLLPNYINLIKIYHYGILAFNLLPIYPLDGGKLLNLFFSSLFTYKVSYYTSLVFSYLFTVFIFIFNFDHLNFNLLLVVIFLFYKITKEYQNINYYYQKFLLERYLNNYHFKDTKIINNINNFYRNKKHLLKFKEKYLWEGDLLAKIYKKSSKNIDFKNSPML